jgi:hypothetical protein
MGKVVVNKKINIQYGKYHMKGAISFYQNSIYILHDRHDKTAIL